MQFVAIVLMVLLTLKLLMMPQRVSLNASMNKSRWLMAAGVALLGIQFLLQYTLQLRMMGVAQAVMLNLMFFVPVSWLLSLSLLYLQRLARMSLLDKWLGLFTCVVIDVMLVIAVWMDGRPWLENTQTLWWAEIVASGFYLCMQLYYTRQQLVNLRNMRLALVNYYDKEMDGLLRWMRLSIMILAIIALMVPFLIFGSGAWLAAIALMFFGFIFHLVDSFTYYVLSSAPQKVQEAEENEEREEREEREESEECTDEKTESRSWEHVEQAVEQWKEQGGHLQNGLKLPNAAESIGVPQYLLSAWLRQNDLKYSEWITNLRIEEAKVMLKTHPTWNNEAIAQHCGFNDRSYFQTVFKRKTGMTPAEFVQS